MIFGPMWHMGQPKIYTKEKCKSLSGKVGYWITHEMNPAENQSTCPNRQKYCDNSDLFLFVLLFFLKIAMLKENSFLGLKKYVEYFLEKK